MATVTMTITDTIRDEVPGVSISTTIDPPEARSIPTAAIKTLAAIIWSLSQFAKSVGPMSHPETYPADSNPGPIIEATIEENQNETP